MANCPTCDSPAPNLHLAEADVMDVLPDEGTTVKALRNLNIRGFNQALKEGWVIRFRLQPTMDSKEWRCQLDLPPACPVEDIVKRKAMLAHNLLRYPIEVWPTEPQAGVLDFWIANRSMNISEVQRLVWENKIAKGFNTTDVPLEFCLLHGEVAEAFQAWRRGHDDFGEELADVALYVFALAQMNGINLDTEINRKISINARRRYRTGSNGVLEEDA